MPFANQLAQEAFTDRYALKDNNGNVIEKEWSEAAKRVAHAVSINDEPWVEDAFREMLEGYYFIPGGRILAAMGAPYQISPYNCYVIPSPEDSCDGILLSLKSWMEVQRRGGGVGINMTSLRPSGSHVRGVNGTSSGPVAWMELFSTMTKEVIQQGGSRRGAAMLILDVTHPDILEFINAKRIAGKLEGANVSVNVTEDFMLALKENREWDYSWGNVYYGSVPAAEIWQAIISAAWASGEPGVVFLDRANEWSNSHYFENLVCTNPCAEQPLGDNAVCLLGAVNLKRHMSYGRMDHGMVANTAALATRFLDNVIDLALYPMPEAEEVQKNIRRMGIGTMGLADALIDAELMYGKKEAVKFTEDAFRTINWAGYESSVKLSKERGPFPAFVTDKYLQGKFINTLPESLQQNIRDHGIRNCFITSQAPTGTIAKLAGVEAGIEPYFARETTYVNRLGTFTLKAPESPYTVIAGEVTPSEHIAMMAAAQRHIDSAVSKTVNAPEEQTIEGAKEVYDLAYSEGCKSVAYYRNNSRLEQVQYAGTGETCDPNDMECKTCT